MAKVVPIEEFVRVEENGAAALLGENGDQLISEASDTMLYGDGGASKTTLASDLALHLASGDDWLGMTVPRCVRVLIIENEGGRAQFRTKMRRNDKPDDRAHGGDRTPRQIQLARATGASRPVSMSPPHSGAPDASSPYGILHARWLRSPLPPI